MNDKQKTLIKLIGSGLLYSAAFFGIFQALVWLYSFFTEPKAQLVAQVVENDFVYPPVAKEYMEELKDKIRQKNNILKEEILAKQEEVLKHTPNEEKFREEISKLKIEINNLQSILDKEVFKDTKEMFGVITQLHLENFKYFRFLTVFELENKGKKQANSVRVKLPSNEFYQILYDMDEVLKMGLGSDQNSVTKVGNIIDVGTMMPRQTVHIRIWSSTSLIGWRRRGFVVSHESGTGSLYFIEKVGFFWVWLSKYWYGLLFGVLLIAQIISIILKK